MTNQEKRYHRTIQILRQNKPETDNGSLLTDSIMEQIKLLNNKQTPTTQLVLRWVSSSAAIFLLGLFLFQQTNIAKLNASNPTAGIVNPKIEIYSECLQNSDANNKKMLEAYLCHIKTNSIKNQRFQSFYNQTKK